ncbi:hypothetical protein [Nitratireductor soli]|uniref:hypothetical protein n=1 Tax=Nitratireductor soli TaxID=1670619 RepID=UPI00065DF74D|nr:hypothetical protein [Nitratireductor soli]
MSALGITEHTLATAVADDGTVAIAYPTGTTAATLAGSTGGSVVVSDGAYGSWDEGASGAEFSYGASTITVTNRSGMTWPAGAEIIVSFGSEPRVGSYNMTTGPAQNQAASNPGAPLELVASGAVPAGTHIVELNHATVVVAATIADAADHAGIFIVKDTSASGTAAHTLTLTAGTFDGTNNVATLNAPAEMLAVYFDNEGNGTILQNTGAVALS